MRVLLESEVAKEEEEKKRLIDKLVTK